MKHSFDEEELIKQSQKGDITAFEKLVERYYQKLYNFALVIVKDETSAEDLTQEALIKAYKKIKKFRSTSSFTTWLYRIIYNTFKDELKKSYKKYEVAPLDGIELRNLILDNTLPEEIIEKGEKQLIIREAIRSIPKDYAFIILLRDLQGLSYEEIANILNIPVGTVKSRLFKARELLKTKVTELLK